MLYFGNNVLSIRVMLKSYTANGSSSVMAQKVLRTFDKVKNTVVAGRDAKSQWFEMHNANPQATNYSQATR